jgi:DNA-binding NarL/FixJ family response regulator
MREALAAALEGEPDLVVAGAAANGIQAREAFRDLQPDVVIMDLMMPLRDGVSATGDIIDQDPNARVLVLTSAVGDERLVQALAAGALGYLLKDAERDEILDAVRRVARGELFLPAVAARKLVRAIQHGPSATPADSAAHSFNPEAATSQLSPRQLAVLTLAAGGLSDAEIAARLVLSESTVRVHFHHIIEKLGAADRAAALAWYTQSQDV